MPVAEIRGIAIAYEILGTTGPWIALSPGGRRPGAAVKSIGERLARAGYHVLLHDRRNCGLSDLAFDDSASEYELWADDLHLLLRRLDALPAIVGGSSSGCRLSLLLAMRHPEAVRALLLWRITGGAFAVGRLTENYYAQYIRAAEAGGMTAVAAVDHFRELIALNPVDRDRLLAMDPRRFIAVMKSWQDHFLAGADQPVIGASAEDLAAIAVPTCIVPGNDRTHPGRAALALQSHVRGSELHDLMGEDLDLDVAPLDAWEPREDELAAILLDFLRRSLF